MAEKERIQDEAVESVSGGVGFGDVAKAFGVDSAKLKNELEHTAERVGELFMNAAKNVQSGGAANGIVANNLEGKSSEDAPGNASACRK